MRRSGETLDEAEIDTLARARELTVGYREAARRALTFARRYRAEEGVSGGAREQACIAQAQIWRRAVRDLHAGVPLSELPAHPGLARATAPDSERGRKTG